MVRSNLDYCSSIWSPYQKDMIHKVEMVQRRAARFVTNRYRNTSSASDMLDHLHWESLETSRGKTQLIMLYKVINNLVDIPASKYLTPVTSRTRAANHHNHQYRQYSTSTDTFKYSFFPRTIPMWNKLPASTAETPSLVSFKRELSTQPF